LIYIKKSLKIYDNEYKMRESHSHSHCSNDNTH